MRKSGDMLDRTGMTAEKVRSHNGRVLRSHGATRRVALASVLAAGAVLAIITVVLAPATETEAFPGRTGGTCGGSSGNCHPAASVSFLTVTGFPAQYLPGMEYMITVTLADTNGLFVGENSFDLILSAGGGTVVGVDQFVKNVSAVQVATNEAYNATVSQWTVKWTAPASGTVTVDTWAVLGTGGAAYDSPYDHTTTNVNVGAIPEFSSVLLPLAGIGAAIVLVSRMSRRKGGN